MRNCSDLPSDLSKNWSYGQIDYFVQHYVFPVYFLLGLFGNSLNLVVLLSRKNRRNQSYNLFSAMALADLLFLLCMLPHSLFTYKAFNRSSLFRQLYFHMKPHLVGLANTFSTTTNFVVLTVSFERFNGVRRPIHKSTNKQEYCRVYISIALAYALAFLINFNHHIEYRVTTSTNECNIVTPYFQHISGLDAPAFLKEYSWIGKYVQLMIGVILPIISVTVLNVSLIYILHKNQISRSPAASTEHNCNLGNIAINDETLQQIRRHSGINKQRFERKVTITVIAIVSCFTITHLPSLGPFIFEQIYGQQRTNRVYHNFVSGCFDFGNFELC